MIVKNDPKIHHGINEGNYNMDKNYVNGFRFWINGNRAIWHINEWNQWAIGDLKNVGSKYRGIRSSVDAQCPEKVRNGYWDFSYKSKWYNAGSNIQIKCLS